MLESVGKGGWYGVLFVDEGDEEGLGGGVGEKAKVVVVERASNGLLGVVDIGKMWDVGREVGGVRVVDKRLLRGGLENGVGLGGDVVLD